MKYPKIIAEFERTQWAITPEAHRGLEKAITEGLTAEDYELFHKTEALSDYDDKKPTVIDGRGLLVINGPIIPRASALSKASGIAAIDQLTRDFKALEADEKVKEIAFLVDSPGGAATGVSDFASLVKASEKPTSAFVVGQAASAAYWLISATDHIASTDIGQVGSIGVVLTYRSESKEGERIIISSQSPDKRPDLDTKEGLAVLQRTVNDIADVFIETVAENRDVSVDKVLKDFGRGSSVIAKRALEAGMIDEISTINDFMVEAKGKKKYELTVYSGKEILQAQQQGRSEIQTLIFKKSNFPTRESATKWARDHDFRADKVDETENSWRLRQQDPGKYQTFRTGKPLSPGVTPVFGILRRQGAVETQPAHAGERTAAMNLAEFLAENPAAKAELEAVKAEAFEAGKAELRKQHVVVAGFMTDNYHAKIRALAVNVLKGEEELATLKGAATMWDIQQEEQNSQAAQTESAELPAPQEVQTAQAPSEDGHVKNETDLEQFYADVRGQSIFTEVA
jgi:ClpP class serine protease